MKKARTIFFLLLALLFFSKNLASYASDRSKSMCYAIDLEEEDSEKKSEKDPLDGKEKFENWIISQSLPAFGDTDFQQSFRYHRENRVSAPYFEIASPPPQQNFLS